MLLLLPERVSAHQRINALSSTVPQHHFTLPFGESPPVFTNRPISISSSMGQLSVPQKWWPGLRLMNLAIVAKVKEGQDNEVMARLLQATVIIEKDYGMTSALHFLQQATRQLGIDYDSDKARRFFPHTSYCFWYLLTAHVESLEAWLEPICGWLKPFRKPLEVRKVEDYEQSPHGLAGFIKSQNSSMATQFWDFDFRRVLEQISGGFWGEVESVSKTVGFGTDRQKRLSLLLRT